MSEQVVSRSPVLEQAPNFRDLGGLPAADGRRIRFGRLYRSEGLQSLGERDLAMLGGLDIELICDLRTPMERERWPSRWPESRDPRRLLMDERVDAGGADVRHVLHRSRDDTEELARAYMLETYRGFPLNYGPTLAAVFRHLLEAQGAAIVHCSAGKDRTGFICALVQHALGVPAEAIEFDYLLSDRHFGRERLAAMLMSTSGFVPPSVDAFRVRKEYLDALLVQIEGQYGSLDGYLESQVGMDAGRRERLREIMLE